MIFYNNLVFRHADVISRHHIYVLAPGTNSSQNCLLPARPNFGLNIKFAQMSYNISFNRFSDMQMSFLAPIFTFRPPYIVHKCILPDRPEFCLNIKFDPIRVINCFIGFY